MTSALVDVPTVALAVLCTALLIVARLPAWVIVIIGAGGGMLLSAF